MRSSYVRSRAAQNELRSDAAAHTARTGLFLASREQQAKEGYSRRIPAFVSDFVEKVVLELRQRADRADVSKSLTLCVKHVPEWIVLLSS